MSGIPVARLFGFEIRIHLSWAVILAVIAVTVAAQVGSVAPDIAPPLQWLAGGVVAAAFLLSALAHELGHALAARRAGLPGGSVIVYFFGGTAAPGFEAGRPRDEVTVAAAGPLVSLVLGALIVGVAAALDAAGTGATDGWLTAAAQIALVVGVLNLVLGAINLLPAFPLDGGRIIQGLAWARTGDQTRALRIAARSGRIIGWGLTGLAIAIVILVDPVDGLMLGLIGWFLTSAARQVDQRARLEALLADTLVDEVLERDVPGVAAALTVDTFADRILDGSVGTLVPVMQDDEFVGVVGVTQIRRTRRSKWSDLRARDLMIARDAIPVVALGTPLRAAFESLRRSGLDGLPVLEGTEVRGFLTRRGLVELLKTRAEIRGEAFP
jgi:Zn-dependent protease/predicted transcriptional regulator